MLKIKKNIQNNSSLPFDQVNLGTQTTGDFQLHGSSIEGIDWWMEADTDNVTETHNPNFHFSQDGQRVYSIIGLSNVDHFDIRHYSTGGIGDIRLSTGGEISTNPTGTLPTIINDANTYFRIDSSGRIYMETSNIRLSGPGFMANQLLGLDANLDIDQVEYTTANTVDAIVQRDGAGAIDVTEITMNNSNTALDRYTETATITLGMTGIWATNVSLDCQFARIGKMVTFLLIEAVDTANTSDNITSVDTVPVGYRPDAEVSSIRIPIQTQDNGTSELGYFIISSNGAFTITKESGAFSGAGSSGILTSAGSYLV